MSLPPPKGTAREYLAAAAVSPLVEAHRGRDPVIPEDLHTIKAVTADRAGQVICLSCGVKTAYGDAYMVGTAGFSCAPCHLKAATASVAPGPRGRRAVWGWLAGAIVVAGVTVTAVWYWAHRKAPRNVTAASETPALMSSSVEVSDEERAWAASNARRWVIAKPLLVQHIEAFSEPEAALAWGDAAMAGTLGPCSIAQAWTSATVLGSVFERGDVSPQDPHARISTRIEARGKTGAQLAQEVSAAIDGLVLAANQRTFTTAHGRFRVRDAVDNDALVLVSYSSHRPLIVDQHEVVAGQRSGMAYAFSLTTGELQCAGGFDTQSSAHPVIDPRNPTASLERDLDANIDRAIAAGLRALPR